MLANGDIKTVGVGDWSATSNGGTTLTKQTASPYEGAQVLRVAPVTTSSAASQSGVTISGNRYIFSGSSRGDGSRYPRFFAGGGYQWTGTDSITWQDATVDYTATDTAFRLYCTTAAGGYTEWDGVSFENLSVTAVAPDDAATLTGSLARTNKRCTKRN